MSRVKKKGGLIGLMVIASWLLVVNSSSSGRPN